MVRVFLFLVLFATNALGQALYCGQDSGLSAKVTLSNLFTYSEQLDNAVWLKGNVTVSANAVIAPDGTLTADTLTATAGNTQHYFYPNPQPAGLGAGLVERMAVYLKKGTHRYVSVGNSQTDTLLFDFDTEQAIPLSTGAGYSKYSVRSVGDGWYRFEVEYVKVSATTRQLYVTMRGSMALVTGVPTFSAAGTETIHVWGMQANNFSDSPEYLQSVATQTHSVVAADIPADYWAWAAISGELQVTALAACVKNVPIYTSATAGYVDDSSGSQTLIQGLSLKETNVATTGFTRLMNAYAIQPMRS
jgi:hypothetical protein